MHGENVQDAEEESEKRHGIDDPRCLHCHVTEAEHDAHDEEGQGDDVDLVPVVC